MNNELSSIMSTKGRMVEFANRVKYDPKGLTAEDKDIAEVLDNWAREIGRSGFDANHEISQMVTKAITTEVVTTPSALIDRMFDAGSIGEFDDIRGKKDPKNTIKVYDSIVGGNVPRSYIDYSVITPTWKSLQAETDITLQDMREGGYKTVANMINYINEALEAKKISAIIDIVDNAITSGSDNYITESTAAPTDANFKRFALYLHDMSDGSAPLAFALNKYIQGIAGLGSATTYLDDRTKNMYNTKGFITEVAGVELMGLSGQKKLADGSFIIPDKRIFGISGKVGTAITRGETNVLQETDINSEKIHIKVNGYTFGTMISDIDKVAKIVMAQ